MDTCVYICGYIHVFLFASGLLIAFILPELVQLASGHFTIRFNMWLLCTLYKPALFPSPSSSAKRVPCVLGPSSLSLLSLYHPILLRMMCFHLFLSSPLTFSFFPAYFEQSCLSKVKCGYRTAITCRAFFLFLILFFCRFLFFVLPLSGGPWGGGAVVHTHAQAHTHTAPHTQTRESYRLGQ